MELATDKQQEATICEWCQCWGGNGDAKQVSLINILQLWQELGDGEN